MIRTFPAHAAIGRGREACKYGADEAVVGAWHGVTQTAAIVAMQGHAIPGHRAG